MYTRVEQIGVYVIENDNQILHYQRKKLQISKEGMLAWTLVLDWS